MGKTLAFISPDQVNTEDDINIALDILEAINADDDYGIAIESANVNLDASENRLTLEGTNTSDCFITIVYTSEKGAMSSKQQKNNVGRAGTGVLDLYSKNFQFVHEDVSLGGQKMPLNISHIYNSRTSTLRDIRIIGGAKTADLCMGLGWKTNYHQYLLPYSDGVEDNNLAGNARFVYIDQYGNEVFIVENKLNFKKTELIDDSGRGLKYSYETGHHILSQQDGAKLYFDENGQLDKVEDQHGVNTSINWSNGKITKVIDGAGRYAYFDYSAITSTNQYSTLSAIRYANNSRTIRFYYNSYFQLTKVTYPDGNSSSFDYGRGSATTYILTDIRDQTGYRVSYDYVGSDNIEITESTNVNKITNDGVTACSEKYGNKVVVEYHGNKTYVKTKDGKRLVHVFNNVGLAYCSYVDSYISGTSGSKRVDSLQYNHIGKDKMFTMSTTGDLTNYVNNNSFESNTTYWANNASAGTSSSTTNIDGNTSLLINGQLNTTKTVSQVVSVPSGMNGLVVSACAKADSMQTNEYTKFRMSVQYQYHDGLWGSEYHQDFDYTENDWQLVAIGITPERTIINVRVKLEYTNNLGTAYFDDVRVVQAKFISQSIENDYCIRNGNSIWPLSSISQIRYVVEGFLGIWDTYENPTNSNLTYDDVNTMIMQPNNTDKGIVVVDGEIITSNALIGELAWSNEQKIMEFKIGSTYYDIYDLDIVTNQTITIEDGTEQKARLNVDENGNITRSSFIGINGDAFDTDYTYEDGKVKTEHIDYRNILVTNTYDNYGNLTGTKADSQSSSSSAYTYASQTEYANYGNTIHKQYDPRGEGIATEFSFDSAFSRLGSITKADGSTVNYNYNSSDMLEGISTTDNGSSISNGMSYTRGLLTKLTDGAVDYTFDYDGFGSIVATYIDGTLVKSSDYCNNSTYTSVDESTFDYITTTHYNNSGVYATKSIFNKHGALTKVIETTNGNNQLMSVTYDQHDRVDVVTDRAMGADKVITHTNSYLDNGKVDKVTIGGYINGELNEEYDSQDKLTKKTIKFSESKQYTYSYDRTGINDYPDNRLTQVNLPTDGYTSYDYDQLGRVSKRNVDSKISETYGYLRGNSNTSTATDDFATNYVSTISYKGNGYNSNTFYTYDRNGNVSTVIVEGSKVIKYTYDSADRLIREDNEALGKTYTYQYDTRGNITTKTERAFELDTSEIDYPEEPDTDSSTGGDSGGGTSGGGHVDLFMSPSMYSQGASTITNYTYSAMGILTRVVRDGQIIYSETVDENNFHANPCNWLGNVLQWTRNRQLASYGNIASYRYDASGIRLEKTAGSTLHRYYTEGSRIHKETRGNNTLWYYYDGTGIIGMDYNGTRYYFHKNIQGDIVRILTYNGDVVGSYTYDAWGNHTIGINTNGIADINPFRYRGYYYDTETGLYYLQSRYYDPETGRFINADSIDYLDPESINGLNLYVYCANNPVMNIDPNGNAWWNPLTWDWGAIGAGALMVIGAVVAIGISIATFGAGTPLAIGIIASVTLGAGVLMGINGIATIGEGMTNGYNFMCDGLFNEVLGLSDDTYNTYSNIVNTVVAVGTSVLGLYSFTGRAQAARAGRDFLGKGYSKVGKNRWVSQDGFRQMRLDKSGHLWKGSSSANHFNLQKFKVNYWGNSRSPFTKFNIHQMYNWFKTWI